MIPTSMDFAEHFDYKDGKLFWKSGKEAGTAHSKGYRRVTLRGKSYLVHRVIYVLLTGEDLEGWQIDHINGDRADNRIENLRKVTSAQNGQNRTVLNRNNKTGHHGIFERGGFFFVKLIKDGKVYRRRRKTLKEALELREQIKSNFEVSFP